ncbi:MAG: heme-copper oxidase subunit III [Thermogemmatispora sp.]|uniref:cytochrome c oxidase subunit 3 n=1 Tax=Thermogemmatispora sp. TaxID=1968838 RepID=UPI00261217A4|nr:cytochrome c oxidase subunit 3 [Thermogemmatispora sp.]MBX5455612.1 heme-copper oxidase subunit III [Thermogemmatispora sp.]
MSVAYREGIPALEQVHDEGGRSVGWWGMMFFIASEALIFANLIAAYLYLEIRQGGHGWRLPSEIWYPLINTVILLGSSAPIHYIAAKGIEKGSQRRLIWGLLATIVMGAIFLGGQVYEYSSLISEGFTPQSQLFGSAFFTLTGFHGLHVTVGLIFLLIVFVRALNGHFTKERHFAFQAGEMYWHFVDAVWVFVFSIVYLLPLLRG